MLNQVDPLEVIKTEISISCITMNAFDATGGKLLAWVEVLAVPLAALRLSTCLDINVQERPLNILFK